MLVRVYFTCGSGLASTEIYCLGHVGRRPLQDIVLEHKSVGGPFPTVREFHDWFSSLIICFHSEGAKVIPDPNRHRRPDDVPITFTHADLHPSNIMVSAESPYRVIAIVDWHQSGWCPDYWEYCKSAYTARPGSEWEMEYLPRLLEKRRAHDIWWWYPYTFGE